MKYYYICLFVLSALLTSCACLKKTAIPQYFALELPEGLGTYYPGQVVYNGVTQKDNLTKKQIKELKKNAIPGLDIFTLDAHKKIEPSIKAKIADIISVNPEFKKNSRISLNLKNLRKIQKDRKNYLGYSGEGDVIISVLIASIEAEIFKKKEFKLQNSEVFKNLKNTLGLNILIEKKDSVYMKSDEIVVGIQTQHIENLMKDTVIGRTKYINLDKNNSNSTYVNLDARPDYPVDTEIIFNFHADPNQKLSKEQIECTISVYSHGSSNSETVKIDYNRLKIKTIVVPVPNTDDQYEIFNIDFKPGIVRENNSIDSTRISITRSINRISSKCPSKLELLKK